jgi:hypothetical protein
MSATSAPVKEGKKSFAPELSASPSFLSGAIYKQIRLPPINNGQSTQTIAPGGTVDITFQITPRVMNLAKTKLFYQMQLAAPGDNGGGPAVNYINVVHNTSFGELQYISLTPETGRTIAEVQNANNYLRMTGLMNMDRETYLENGYDDAFAMSKVAAANNVTATPALYQANGAAGGAAAVAATVPDEEVKYLDFGAEAAVYPAAGSWRNRRVPLGMFKGTILSLDKDIYFPCNMILKVTLSVPKIGFRTLHTSTATPYTGAVPLAGNVTFQNFNLLVAQETRPDIIEQVRAFYSKPGVTIPIEWLKVQKSNQQGNQHNPQLNISSADGKFIRRIISSPFAAREDSNYGLDNSNIIPSAGTFNAGGKVISYRTVLDSNPIQNYDVSCVPTNLSGVNAGIVPFPSEDYEHNRKFLHNSGVLDIWAYYKSWFHVEDFLGFADKKQLDAFTIGGMPTTEPHKYEIVAQTVQDSAGAFLTLNWYQYAVMGRDLVFTGNTVDLV